jgi:hypothetical protein
VWINGYRWMSGVDQWVPVDEWWINGCRWMSGADQLVDEWVSGGINGVDGVWMSGSVGRSVGG